MEIPFDRERPEFSMTLVGEQMYVQMNAVLLLTIENEIARLVGEAKKTRIKAGDSPLEQD